MQSYPHHEPYHHRTLEQQKLDALLRIEEILGRAFPAEVVIATADITADGKPSISHKVKNYSNEPITDPDGHVVGYARKKRK